MASGDRRKGRPLKEDPVFQKIMQETAEEIAAEQELEGKKSEKKKTNVRKPEKGEGEQIEVIDVDEEDKKKKKKRSRKEVAADAAKEAGWMQEKGLAEGVARQKAALVEPVIVDTGNPESCQRLQELQSRDRTALEELSQARGTRPKERSKETKKSKRKAKSQVVASKGDVASSGQQEEEIEVEIGRAHV